MQIYSYTEIKQTTVIKWSGILQTNLDIALHLRDNNK